MTDELYNNSQIVVHADSQNTDTLIDSCAKIRAMTRDIYAPAQGESIQIGQQTNSFSVSLSDALLASVKMSRVSDFDQLNSLTAQ